MSRTATLSQLLDDIDTQADVIGADLRHTPARKTRVINQSIQRFREAVSIHGISLYLQPTTGTLTAGVESPYSFRTLDISGIQDMVRPFGLDLTLNNCIQTLDYVPFEFRNDYGTTAGTPQAWSQYNQETLVILPAPAGPYPYTLWYLPSHADLVNDNDTFRGTAGWEDYIVWDCVVRLMVRDQNPEAMAMAQQYRAEVWRDILRTASRANRGGPSAIGRDTFGSRHRGRRRGDFLPPP